jgi:hypothetical protein
MVKPVDALCPMPKAPEPGFLRKPAPVFEPGGRPFWIKFTTTTALVLNMMQYSRGLHTHSAGSVVAEAFDKLDDGNCPGLPWDATRDTGKSSPFFLGGEGSEEVGVVILD